MKEYVYGYKTTNAKGYNPTFVIIDEDMDEYRLKYLEFCLSNYFNLSLILHFERMHLLPQSFGHYTLPKTVNHKCGLGQITTSH